MYKRQLHWLWALLWICDEVFRMNEQGKAEAYQPANAENQGAVQEAIDSCPVSAIAWED